jgi:alkanesulfonate monooxygenase SsuD/methylene tetrahydromethanopterin reductase-like flavin-dependent oxidoreductase (luciferase family)
VRVLQDFATLDLLSGGRAEIMAGRGSFTESFPLFGYNLDDYDDLFDEKLRLLLRLREDEHVRWSGRFRPALDGEGVYPRPIQQPLPVWVAVGGAPESAFRAGTLGLPMALAIIGGIPERFAPFVQLYRDAARDAGHDPTPPVSINSHGYIAATEEEALDDSWPYAASMMNRIGRERGWQPMQREHYDAASTLRGANFVGTPQMVIDKILFQHELFHHDRFLVQFTVGSLPHAKIMRSIELLGTEVAPVVRAALAVSA